MIVRVTSCYSHPTIGTCGYTMPEAEEKFGKDNLKVYESKFTAMYHGMCAAPPHCLSILSLSCPQP